MDYQKGTLDAVIWCRTNDFYQIPCESSYWYQEDNFFWYYKISMQLAYEVDTTVNGLELTIEKPDIYNASSLEEDIYNSALEHFKIKRFDQVNYLNK